jgi:polyisoprenoid-binding protein YceI
MTTATTFLPGLTTGTWNIDAVHSSITFTVRHLLVSKVRGEFTDFSGAVTVAADGTPSVEATIAVASVTTKNKQRDEHLRTSDFFDAKDFPTATFASTGVRVDGETLSIDGTFTLRGVTLPVTLTGEFHGVNPGMGQGAVAGFEVATTISRKDFGVSWDAKTEAGGAVVSDKVTISLEIELNQQ